MLAGLGKVPLNDCIKTSLIRQHDISYVKTTLLLRKITQLALSQRKSFALYLRLGKLRKKVFPF